MNGLHKTITVPSIGLNSLQRAKNLSQALDDLLQAPLNGVTRITIQHIPTQTFRWLGIIEGVFLLGAFCCVVLPTFLILFVLSGGSVGNDGLDLKLPNFDRFHYRWHDLRIVAWSSDTLLFEKRLRVLTEREGNQLVAALLDAAGRQGVMVVETVGNEAHPETTRWYGGRPLMAPLNLSNSEQSWDRLQRAHCQKHVSDTVEVRYSEGATGRITLIIRLIGRLLLFPLLIQKHNKKALQRVWGELKTGESFTWSFTVSETHIRILLTCGQVIQISEDIDGLRLLGISWAPSLSFGSHAQLEDPTLQFVSKGGIQRIAVPQTLGAPLCNFLIAETLRLRALHPELKLPCGPPPPTLCPYCGALYLFVAGEGCPSCGGWPEKVSSSLGAPS